MGHREEKFKEFFTKNTDENDSTYQDEYFCAWSSWKEAIGCEREIALTTMKTIRDRLRSKSVSIRAFNIIDAEINKYKERD